MIYTLLRCYCRAAVFAFFGRVDAEGTERVPESGPVLLVSNHTNALVDPIVVLLQLRRRVTLTAKSTLRHNPLLSVLMQAMGVIAFHRRQDRDLGAHPEKNAEALAECRRRLRRGEAILVFPEGGSHSDPKMRRFKTGAARIALDYCTEGSDFGDLKIVPVGLWFEQKGRFRSRASVRFGQPIDVAAWCAVHPGTSAQTLTEYLEREVTAITLNFERHADSELFIWTAGLLATGGAEPAPLGQMDDPDLVRTVNRLKEGYEPLRELDPERLNSLEKRVARYRHQLTTLGVSPAEVFLPVHAGRALFFLVRELELLLVGLPTALWGAINHLLPFATVAAATRRLSTDEDHVASNAVFVGLPVFPLFYLLQGLAAFVFFGGWAALLYVVALPWSGAVALLYRDRSGSVWRRTRTFVHFLLNRQEQARLVREGRDLLAEIEHGGREVKAAARPLVLTFDDRRATELATCGGKGANLALLTRAGFPVPPGMTVTAEAYRAFVATVPELPRAVAGLDFSDPGKLHRQCSEIREWLVRVRMPPELEEALALHLPALLVRGPVSVRSSSTLEDLAGAAFAGQHDTYLNVRTLPQVIDAVRRSYASLWQDRAVAYRQRQGFSQQKAAMAVVVQAMVSSEVAGVGFSLHPVSGDLDQLVLNSSYGLGETVVSGEGDVDQFVVDKRSGEIVERSIATKTHTLVSSDEEGTVRRELDSEDTLRPSLTDAQIGELLELTKAVEDFYAFPQDMEWAFAGGRLWLLQSRPVSSIPPSFTREESAERFPNVITPLTWDFTSDGFHESLSYSLELLGLPRFTGKWFERLGCYVYGNQNAVRIYTSGRQVTFSSLEELETKRSLFRQRYAWVQELPVTWLRDLDDYLRTLGHLEAAALTEMTAEELWRHLLEIDALGRAYFRPNIAISITQGVLHRMLFQVVALVVGDEEAAALYDELTAFCETKTNLVNRDLNRLYRLTLADQDLSALLLETDRRRIWEEDLLAAHPTFAKALARFLRDHGHREVDFDAYHPTWSGQPWVVLENLRLLISRGDAEDPGAREIELRARQQAAEQRFLALVPAPLGFFVAELLRLARVYTSLDDLEHYQTTRLTVPFRDTLVELGRRLRERGAVDEPEDVFFLRKATIESLMEGRTATGEAHTEADGQKAEYLERRRVTPPDVWGEEPAEVAGGDLRGLPGSQGVAEGCVCLVHGVEDFPRFEAQSVLVARTTNPAWTPLFYSAAAVITESGGPLSHGAVTAREVGLPAVMSVRGVLGILKDGERVRVNGSAGIVTRLERE